MSSLVSSSSFTPNEEKMSMHVRRPENLTFVTRAAAFMMPPQ